MSLYDYFLESSEDDEYGIEFFAFAGAGTNGCAYCGTVESLEKRNLLKKIRYWIGTSAGAAVAGALAMGGTSSFISERIGRTDFSKFLDYGGRISGGSWWGKILDYHYSITELISKLGAARGQELQTWIEKIIVELGFPADITLSDLYQKTGNHLVTVVTDLNSYDVLYLSRSTYPEMTVASAVFASVLIPILFQPYSMTDPLTGRTRLLLDGGVLDNLPINACDPQTSSGKLLGINRKAVGVFTISNGQWGPSQTVVDGFMKFSSTLLATMFRQLQVSQSHQPFFWDRVIPIETYGHSPVDFSIDQETIQQLIRSGYESTERFLENRRQMIQQMGPLPGNLFIPIAGRPLTNDALRDTLIYSPNPEIRKIRNQVGV